MATVTDPTAFIPFLIGLGFIFFIFALAVYIYMAIATMAIARKTKTENGWLAFIPIANMYLYTKMAGVPWWTFLIAFFGSLIPFIGGIVFIVFFIWWWWKIAEHINRPGWWSILLIIPIVNLIIIGIMAWGE